MKQAIIFKAKLPNVENIEKLVGEFEFKPVGEMCSGSHGFEFADKVTKKFASVFDGGYSLTYRLDQKIIPPSVIKEKLSEKCEALESELGRKLKRTEKDSLKSDIICELLPVALVKTQRINILYGQKSETLYVATSSEKKAQICVSQLVKAMGSLKTSTIHIDNIKVGIAAKIKESLSANEDSENQGDFGSFSIGGSLVLIDDQKDKISYTIDDINARASDIVAQIESGYKAKQVELIYGDSICFKLNERFVFSGIKLLEDMDDEDFEDKDSKSRHVTSLTVSIMDGVVKELCEIFEYKDK